MIDKPRLIEHAFPLKQASLDSVHEHISTPHIRLTRPLPVACPMVLTAQLVRTAAEVYLCP